jgi:tetratricopeptide (TPR) repeat protein
MSAQTTTRPTLPRGLVLGVLGLTFVVLLLGGAILALKLRPEPVPTDALERDVYAWRQATEQRPEDDQAFTGLGLALIQVDRDGEALGAFERAIELNDENWVSLMQVGVLVADDDPTRASDLLARSAEFAPDGSKTLPLVAHGDLLVQQGAIDEARRAYQLAIVDSPFIVESHLGLARVLEETGDLKGALQEYEEAAKFDPGNPEIEAAIERLGKDT